MDQCVAVFHPDSGRRLRDALSLPDPFDCHECARRGASQRREAGHEDRRCGRFAGIILAAVAVAWTIGQLEPKFGVPGVLVTVPAVGLALGALNGVIIAKGRLQPFIVTLAMMVAILGLARLLAGQDAAVYPVYTGSNATEDFDVLRALVFNVVPVPGIFFLFAVFSSGLF